MKGKARHSINYIECQNCCSLFELVANIPIFGATWKHVVASLHNVSLSRPPPNRTMDCSMLVCGRGTLQVRTPRTWTDLLSRNFRYSIYSPQLQDLGHQKMAQSSFHFSGIIRRTFGTKTINLSFRGNQFTKLGTLYACRVAGYDQK